MARVAIVIVTYNSAAEIVGCLNALRHQPDAEVVVVDNASSDDTAAIVRSTGVRLLASPTNLGFAGGVNLGVRETTAPLILLLNPDAHLLTGVEALIESMQPPTGYAGGLLLGDDGLPQTGFMIRRLPTPTALAFEVLGLNRLFPRNPVNWNYRCRAMDPMAHGFAEQPAGAFLMFTRQAWLEVGGLDESFMPVWFEDVDFCARLRQAGYRGDYVPAARARHTGGHSVSTLGVGIRHKYWYGNLLEYAAKHFGIIGFRGVAAAVVTGALLRAVTGWPLHGARAFRIYGEVLQLAWSRLIMTRTQLSTVAEHKCEKSGGRDQMKSGADSRKHVR